MPSLLKPGDMFESLGTVYVVSMVNASRAFCVPVNANRVRRVLGGGVELEKDYPGGGINVSPSAASVRLLSEEEVQERLESKPGGKLVQGGGRVAVAIPVAKRSKSNGKAVKKANASRKETLAKSKEVKARVRKAKAVAKGLRKTRKCVCGCGGETMAYFVPGHDMRWKGWLKKLASGEKKRSDFSKSEQAALAKFQWRKSGNGVVPTKNYKGEANV